jgi:hypothetical protein
MGPGANACGCPTNCPLSRSPRIVGGLYSVIALRKNDHERERRLLVSWAKAGECRGRERRLLLSWAKAGKDSKESREATRSEGDDLEESSARALMRHGGRGRGVRGEGRR